jgi:hypothetical protein
VDGVRHVIGKSHQATPTSDTNPQFTNAFQLDLNSAATAYHVYVDNMTVSIAYAQ